MEEKENIKESASSAYDPDDEITFEWAGRAEGMCFDED